MTGESLSILGSDDVMIMIVTILRSTVEVEMYTRTQVTGVGIGSQTVNSGEEVTLSCQVRIIGK